ncbi:MAG: bifunctional homocysteine S-methyltransferase/methylenetetrahydrofolate reductase [Nitrospiraceae bacterium]|nr:bifunctional homocysteine S-methyltransferase/methylenetetrahydrofolate reductase [Nitrospiraceae bacterium]
MSDPSNIQECLSQGVVIFDGAMGTEIYAHNVLTNRCFDELCLSRPELVREVHASYANAGADVLTTNTFGANRVSLGKYGLADEMVSINQAGVALAREVADAAGRPVFVAGSVGPLPNDRPKDVDAVAVLREQVDALVEAGVDFVSFETQPSREALEQCARVMEAHAGFPFVLSCVVYDDCESASGEALQRLLAPMSEGLPAPIAWGLNCGTGPAALLSAAEQAVRLVEQPLIVQPNAGIPKEIGERRIYLCSPDYLAGYAKRYLELGVRGIGGCCGTSPDHIREIAQRIKPLAKGPGKTFTVELAASVTPQEPERLENKSRLGWRLANGTWITTVEILPPRGYDLTDTIAKARELYVNGVDAINIPDGPRASSRISPLITSLNIQREARIEVILHFCSRDRNLIGMQADLLACAASGIHNILFVTGDPPKLGNYPFATGVFDVDSIGMCGVQSRLNQGIDIGGQAIEPKTKAAIGVGADPTMLDQEREVRRFHEKVEAGAEYAITQPVFDPDALLAFLDKVQHLGTPMLAGIWPLASLRNAEFLQNEVPGVTIPENTMARMSAYSTKEDQRRVGIEIAREAVERVRDRVAGIQVSAPFGNIHTALAVIQ